MFTGSANAVLVIDLPFDGDADDDALPAAPYVVEGGGSMNFNAASQYPDWVYSGTHAIEVIPGNDSFNGANYTQTISTGEFSVALCLGQEVVSTGSDIVILMGDSYVQFCEDDGGRVQAWIGLAVQGEVMIETDQGILGDPDFNHIVVTYDAHYLRIYVDGALAAESEDLNEALSTINNVKVGIQQWLPPLQGAYDEVKIYDHGLTAGEVSALYLGIPTPTIDTQPISQSVFMGASVDLIVEATNPVIGNSTGLEYVWYKDGSTLDPNVITPTLSIANAVPGDAGDYYCKVTITSNGGVKYSNVATLTFLDPGLTPVIDTDPLSQVKNIGESVTFTVEATNPYTSDSTGLEYLWYKDGSPTSEITDTLSIASVTSGDFGDYYCRVTLMDNDEPPVAQSADSAVATLYEPLPPQMIMYMPMDGDPNNIASSTPYTVWPPAAGLGVYSDGVFGQSLDFRSGDCEWVNYGVTFVTVGFTAAMWVEPYGPGDSWTSLLEIPGSVTLEHSGNAANMDYTINFPGGAVTIVCPGAFDGAWRHIVCTYDGHYMKTYKDGVLQQTSASDMNQNFPYSDGGIRFSPQDGPYNSWRGAIDDVRIYNYALDATAVTALYAYSPNPSIVTQPENIVITALGGTETFTLVAENPEGGSTDLAYQWYHDGEVMAGETATDLVLTSIDAEDFGEYYCIVSLISNSALTTTSNTVTLNLYVPPQLLIHAPMDGDPNDIIAPVDPYTATGALTYNTGEVGQALALNWDGSTSVTYDTSI